MNSYKFKISFRLKHPTDDLDVLSKKLGNLQDFTLGRIWRKREQRESVQGEKLDSQHNNSYCYFDLTKTPVKSDDKSLANAIESILVLLEGFKKEFDEHTASNGTLELFVGIFIDANSGETFEPGLMERLAKLNIALSIDLYPSE